MGIIPKISVLFVCLYVIGASADVTKTKYTITSIKSKPFLMELNNEKIGFAKDLADELCKRIDGDCEIKLVKDGRYGTINSTTGKWTGMIGELLDHKCDMVVADLTITSERVKAVDFSRPVMMSKLAVVHKMKTTMDSKDNNNMMMGDFFVLLKPMTAMVWISFVLIMLMHIGLISLIETKMMATRGDKENLMKMSKCPKSLGGRFMSMMFMVWMIMFIAVYISTLIAQRMDKMNMSNMRMKSMKFSTLEEMVNNPDMKYGFINGGATAMFFKHAKNPLYARIHHQVKEWQTMMASGTEGILKVLEDEDANFAFIMESKSAEFMINKHCDLYMIPEMFGPEKGYCVAMRKNSTIMSKINVEILKMKEEGMMEEMYNKWWKSGSPCHHHKMNNMMMMDNMMTMPKMTMKDDCMECRQVTMMDMGCMYLFIACSMIMGIMLAVFDSRRNK